MNVGSVKDSSAVTTQAPLKETPSDTNKTETYQKQIDEELDKEFIYNRKITISLVPNHSLYRKVNDKVLPKRRDVIGSSYKSSQVLSSNKEEIEAYFPSLIGVAVNNSEFVTRVKAWLNNINVVVDELGKELDVSFRFRTKRDYLSYQAKKQKIEDVYASTKRQDVKALKEALEIRIKDTNELESTLHRYGNPINLSDYLIYRHCLLYNDIAKDMAFVNSNSNIRFYFRDNNRENELKNKLRRELNNAKTNYVTLMGNAELFDAVFIQYCVSKGINISTGLYMDETEKQNHLDRFSSTEPNKFNKYCNDKDIKVKATIEKLIARGELFRAVHNQNITTAEGELIGANIKEAVIWFNNINNAAKVKVYIDKLSF